MRGRQIARLSPGFPYDQPPLTSPWPLSHLHCVVWFTRCNSRNYFKINEDGLKMVTLTGIRRSTGWTGPAWTGHPAKWDGSASGASSSCNLRRDDIGIRPYRGLWRSCRSDIAPRHHRSRQMRPGYCSYLNSRMRQRSVWATKYFTRWNWPGWLGLMFHNFYSSSINLFEQLRSSLKINYKL